MNGSFVRRRLLVHPGEQFSPDALEKARQDLLATGVFSSVRLVPAEQLDREGRLPITFQVTERPRHAVTFGAAYSTDLGAYVTATWSHRNLFGNAEQLNLTAGFTGRRLRAEAARVQCRRAVHQAGFPDARSLACRSMSAR